MSDSLVNTKRIAFQLTKSIGYLLHGVQTKILLQKTSGTICLLSFDKGESMPEKTSPFDNFIQLLEGRAEIIIDKTLHTLLAGECIILPSHRSHSIKASKRTKLLIIVMKSGYED